ncbi:T9SS type A sorting domain-containing protein [Ferruginibacter profundus]
MEQIYFKLKRIFAVVLLLGGGVFYNANAQTGYIYVHKKALNETASIDFPFTVSGGSTAVAPFTLNDQPQQLRVKDIGSSQNGRLWAIDETGSTLYYRDVNSNTWVQTSITNASRVDGDMNGTAVYINTSGTVFSTNGTTTTQISVAGAYSGTADIGSGWDGLPYVAAGGNIYRYSGTGTNWNLIANNLSGSYAPSAIDVNPLTGDAYIAAINNSNVVSAFKVTAAGVVTNIGAPAGLFSGGSNTPRDIAVNDKGEVFLSAVSTSWYVFKYSGGSWSAAELTSFDVSNLTGGVGGELWITMNSGGQNFGQPTVPYYNIFTRATDGTNIYYIDDERVRTTAGNSILIPVTAGTYTITEAVSGGWDLQNIILNDPTNNSSSNQVAGTATLDVAAGETVNVVFQNGELNPVAMTNDCSASYLETFGTGAVGSFGSLVPGQTSYHFLSNAVRAEDGYCKIVSTAFPDFNNWQASNFYDHTSGNGTGRMYAVNAGYDKGEFFRRRFTGVIPGATYNFSAWAANLTPGGSNIRPNIKFQVLDHTSQAVLATFNSGDISTATSQWIQYGFSFTATANDIDLLLSNNAVGGSGNDLAIDDISFALIPVSTPVTTVANTGCGTSGSITVTSPVGASYEYSKDGFVTTPQSSPVFSNLVPGTYTISARFVGTLNCITSKVDVISATICGNIWDDANGNAANSGENPITSGIWVNLVDPVTHAVLQSVQVDASGNYSFTGLPQNTSYQVILTTANQTGNLNLTTSTIPTGFVATGTNLSGVANTTNKTGVITVNTGTGGLTQQNFGIEKLPDTDPKTQTVPYPNGGIIPAGTVTTAVSGADFEDGTLGNSNTIVITSLPANATMYYNGVAVTAGQQITGFNPALVSFGGITNGSTSVVFNYAFIDAAGKQDPTPASYTLNWLGALPVILESFTATKENDKVRLSWRTLTEQNVSKFTIEYSKDGNTFTVIADVAAAGNSSAAVNYSWLHTNPVAGNNYYRLKMTDLDGKYIYISTNLIKISRAGEVAITVYPNPVHNALTVSLPKPGTVNTMLHIYSSDGKLVYTRATGNAQTIPVQVSTLANGVYYIRIIESGKTLYDTKFVKQ